MNVGLLGCGAAAYWLHLRALRGLRGTTLVAAADPDAGARTRVARATGVRVYERAEDLLARDDIEAVLICVPTHLHAALALAAASAGKHFYLEKPIATTLDDAHRVIAAASSAKVAAAIGFNRRHHPLFEQARHLLAEGAIGRVHAVQTTFCEPDPAGGMPGWKRRRATGGGVLLDLGSHHVDQVRWMLGTEVRVVAASLSSERTEHDEARVELETGGGASVQCFLSFRTGPSERMEFLGERGTLALDRHAATLTLSGPRRRGYGGRRRRVLPSPPVLAWRIERLGRVSADPSYRRALRAFGSQLRGGPPAAATLADGLRALEAIVEAERAAGTRGAPTTPGGGTCASS
jgi:predicted dehydrogenase